MKMWPHTSGIIIEPPAPKVLPGRPRKSRRKAKNEPRKRYGKLSKKGAKMTCSICHQVGHNKKACQLMKDGMGQSAPRQQPSSHQPLMSGQPSSLRQPPMFSSQPPMSSQASSSSQHDSSICFGTSAIRRQQHVSRGTGRGIGRGRGGVSSQQHDMERAMRDSTSTGKQKRAKTVGFGIFTNANGSQTLNPGTSGESVVTPGAYKDASPTNIDIGYKPRGLRWNGGDAVTTSQLQRMSQSRKNQRADSNAPMNA